MLVPQTHHTPTCARYVGHLRANGRGNCYSVTFRAKLIVSRPRDPECNAQGIIGKLTMLAEKAGRPRIIIEIGGAARLCVKEGPVAAYYESAK